MLQSMRSQRVKHKLATEQQVYSCCCSTIYLQGFENILLLLIEIETNCWLSKGLGQGEVRGINLEFGINLYTLLYVK